MKKLIKELKENKYTTIVFCIFLGLFLVAWILYGMVMPKTGTPVYGNRLEGIEEVELTAGAALDGVAEGQGLGIGQEVETDAGGSLGLFVKVWDLDVDILHLMLGEAVEAEFTRAVDLNIQRAEGDLFHLFQIEFHGSSPLC